MRPAGRPGTVQPHGRLPKTQCTMVSGGVCPLTPQTKEHQTSMDTPLRVRWWVTGIGTGAVGEEGKKMAGTSETGYADHQVDQSGGGGDVHALAF